MDFERALQAIADRYEVAKEILQTEEATKTSLVLPMIQLLGYNVFDPLEVVPEFTSDIGTKKGEKVDYAINYAGQPALIFECKKSGADLKINHASQLFRYFHVTSAKFAVLTNGTVYRFFSDLDEPNKMDSIPFFEFDLLDFTSRDLEQLQKFSKSTFDVDAIVSVASELKMTRHIKTTLSTWINEPSDEFIKLAAGELLNGKRFTPAIRAQFFDLTKNAFQSIIYDELNSRFKKALGQPTGSTIMSETPIEERASDGASIQSKDIITTQEEIEGFFIVKSLLRKTIDVKRVVMRDAQSYCAILLDDNNRKPICRLRFNNPNRLVLGLFNGKDEEKIPLESLDDIYHYRDKIRWTAESYDNLTQSSVTNDEEAVL